MSKKTIAIVLVVALLAYFVIFNRLLFSNGYQKGLLVAFDLFSNNNATNEQIDDIEIDLQSSRVLKTTEWIVNHNIIQHATIISFTENNETLEIESNVLFSNEREDRSSVRCALTVGDLLVYIKPLEIKYLEHNEHTLFLVKCAIERSQLARVASLDRILVAIVDSRKYNTLPERFSQAQDMFFHKPNVLVRLRPKLKANINCVQTVRGINENYYKNIINWLQIHQLMGVAKVRFCLMDYENTYAKQIRAKFVDYLEVAEFETNINKICARLNLTQTCVDSFKHIFTVGSLFEKICENECLLNSKHLYQYITNYDIDEFIFPRQFSTEFPAKYELVDNISSDCSNAQDQFVAYKQENEKLLESYNMHSYIKQLEQKYGNNVACFMFENYMVLNLYESFYTNMSKLKEQNAIDYVNDPRNTFLRFMFNSQADKSYFDKLKSVRDLTRCLNRTMLTDIKLEDIWRNGLMSLLNNRFGKSISNTDYVYSLNPHSCSLITPGSRKVTVPVEMGFASHFRLGDIGTATSTTRVNWMVHNVKKLTIDLEYIFFLVHNAQRFR